MASNKSVTVLAPNGRRQTVKITPNSTILQILEEVCQKQGYSSKRWDIKHFNKVLDANSIMRFTGLPNNATLEMAPRSNDREMSIVKIGVQLENGQRVMGDFAPDTSLMDIVKNLCPNEESDNTVITYMHQEVHGRDKLSEMTLQSLGLNDGRAMLRLLHRDLDKLNTQAHVAGQLNSKPSNKSNDSRTSKAAKKATNMAQNVTSQIKKALDPITTLKNEKGNNSNNNNGKNKNFPKSGGHKLGEGPSGSSIVNKSKVLQEKSQPIIKENKNEVMDCVEATEANILSQEIEDTMEYIGERNALIFSQEGARAVPREDLPDNFFDLTVDDAKVLIRDAKRQRDNLEGGPLMTNALRELEKSTTTLKKLNKYRKTIIRIQFPNKMVLQAIFTPLETVQIVKDFVKNYLANPEQSFDLYVTPPKKNLNPQSRLVDENLVPSAIIYYSGISELKSELKNKCIDPNVASKQAIKSRMAMTRANKNTSIESEVSDENITTNLSSPGETSTSSMSSMTNTLQENATKITAYAPKWFKRAFK
ncbi:hypothetical protein HCN44_011320 [Aphidius gifuensis]|uniref:UBX domain-containing protein n=1 Tax=Aphidius gifuensis TaxID=684658 RepID=A0A834Y035_APHGI|nr:tether containing UBX domain for GLUT4 [Aphidius gifuensis]XP_044006575.1 tether containing UBX domain for GLUT4 [Aphidius gifuensis]KAF7994051.1 hypothetical protein HCN44_011320 [Aphidius gifuensis]